MVKPDPDISESFAPASVVSDLTADWDNTCRNISLYGFEPLQTAMADALVCAPESGTKLMFLDELEQNAKARGPPHIAAMLTAIIETYVLHVAAPLLSYLMENFDNTFLTSVHIVPLIRSLLDVSMQNPPNVVSTLGAESAETRYVNLLLKVAYNKEFWTMFQTSWNGNIERMKQAPKVLHAFIASLEEHYDLQLADVHNIRRFILALIQLLLVGPHLTTKEIAWVIEFSLRRAWNEILRYVMGRLLSGSLLLPLLPDMVTLAVRYNAVDVLAPVIQTTLLKWIKTLLCTPDASVRVSLDVSKWSCSCKLCRRRILPSLKNLLKEGTSLRNLSSDDVRHTKMLCRKHLPSGFQIVTAPTSGTLKFSFSHDLFASLAWQAEFDKGKEYLTILKQGESFVRRVLGQYHSQIMAGLKWPPVTVGDMLTANAGARLVPTEVHVTVPTSVTPQERLRDREALAKRAKRKQPAAVVDVVKESDEAELEPGEIREAISFHLTKRTELGLSAVARRTFEARSSRVRLRQ
ncbi:hypothetical protein EIP91_000328 [Steccherinum ochraceum]|uniref:Uncharacterized protein n=1 Tax=Steccherinum ochraceum TaxID=92696 RepID=A0A4R0RG82_9APHY|nr:hypothetical protein EIP91_000328 [Steccherinum ochraceum]